MPHPLTDKIISKQFGRYDGIDDVMVYDEDDVRAAYDRGRGDQLKQVIKWLKDNTSKYVYHDYYGADEQQELFKCLEDLQKAMRPTTQEDKS
jgi:hypothetical protein